MVIINLIGGLGNQLFQYAAASSLAKRSGRKLVLDISEFDMYQLHQLGLKHFNVLFDIADTKLMNNIKSGAQKSLIERALNKAGIYFSAFRYYYEPFFPVDHKLLNQKKGSVYVKGYFQSEKYFTDNIVNIREELKIITPPSAANIEVLDKISACNAVSLHVRRGDYVTDPEALRYHGVCDLQYYHHAVAFMAKEVNNPVFFVFSDDITWAKENIKVDYETHFVDINDADTNYEDLRLMSSCKHHIVANSSFSWWGAWLNTNISKKVVAPKKWFATDQNDTRDLLPDSWIKL